MWLTLPKIGARAIITRLADFMASLPVSQVTPCGRRCWELTVELFEALLLPQGKEDAPLQQFLRNNLFYDSFTQVGVT